MAKCWIRSSDGILPTYCTNTDFWHLLSLYGGEKVGDMWFENNIKTVCCESDLYLHVIALKWYLNNTFIIKKVCHASRDLNLTEFDKGRYDNLTEVLIASRAGAIPTIVDVLWLVRPSPTRLPKMSHTCSIDDVLKKQGSEEWPDKRCKLTMLCAIFIFWGRDLEVTCVNRSLKKT